MSSRATAHRHRRPIAGLAGIAFPKAGPAQGHRFTAFLVLAVALHGLAGYVMTLPGSWRRLPTAGRAPLSVTVSAAAPSRAAQPAPVRPARGRPAPALPQPSRPNATAQPVAPYGAPTSAAAPAPARPAMRVLAWTLSAPDTATAGEGGDSDGDAPGEGGGAGDGTGLEGYEPPRRLQDVKPAYPPQLRALGKEGNVVLAVTVNADGSVGGVEVAAPDPNPAFNEAAVEAAWKATYVPPQLHHAPIAATIRFTVRFRLADR
jgi:TonB family protein